MLLEEQVEMIITCCTDQALETAARAFPGSWDLPCYIGGMHTATCCHQQTVYERNV